MGKSNTQFIGDIAISKHKGVGAVYNFKNSVDKNTNTVTTVKVEVKDKTGEIASWGQNNKYPQEIVEAMSQSGSGSAALRFLRKAHYGGGIILFNDEPTEDGKKAIKLIQPSSNPEIDAFFKKSQIKKYQKQQEMSLIL
jgi:hypothetical protein